MIQQQPRWYPAPKSALIRCCHRGRRGVIHVGQAGEHRPAKLRTSGRISHSVPSNSKVSPGLTATLIFAAGAISPADRAAVRDDKVVTCLIARASRRACPQQRTQHARPSTPHPTGLRSGRRQSMLVGAQQGRAANQGSDPGRGCLDLRRRGYRQWIRGDAPAAPGSATSMSRAR